LSLLSAAVCILKPVRLAVDELSRKETNCLTADAAVKFMIENFGNRNSEIGTELHGALKIRISQRRKNTSQVLQYLQREIQDDSVLFPRLIRDTKVKIVLRFIKRLYPSANDEQNLNLEDQHGTEH
jgi:cellulose biosynthesis protein BcsQ